MVGAYQRGEAVSLIFLGVRETRFAAARDSSSRALATLAGLPERSGRFFFDGELFFETFSELLSASSFVDFFSKATLGLLTAGGRWLEATAIHLDLA